jgi:hypothetical protein
MAQGQNKKSLNKRVYKGSKGYPIATVVFYGPDNTRASKVACSNLEYEDAEPETMRKWFSNSDTRKSEKIPGELISFVDEHEANTVAMLDKIFGCPHEEGIDYPEGESCPECPYWKNRDRYTHELEN